MNSMNILNLVVLIIVIVVALDMGLRETFNMDLISKIPFINKMDKILGALVGGAGIYLAYLVISQRKTGQLSFQPFLSKLN